MERAVVNGIELAYEVTGLGDPVLLIHGAHLADAFLPLVGQPALEAFQLIRYHRRGLGESRGTVGVAPTTMEEQAADAVALLDHLGVERTHVVGQSSGGSVALELASRHPARVVSLALLEPAILTPGAGEFLITLVPRIEEYQRGDSDAAVRHFLGGFGGEHSLAAIERNIPGGLDQAIRDASRFYESELPAGPDWSFGDEEASHIRCPVLSVLGEHSTGMWLEGRDALHYWFPDCEDADIPGTGHLLQIECPEAVAEALAAFLNRTRAGIAGLGVRL